MTTLPNTRETAEMVELFRLAPPDMLEVTICQFRRFYFIAKHQNHLRPYAELYAEAIRQLGGEVRFNTAEESQLIA
jgi:hypothetical protein